MQGFLENLKAPMQAHLLMDIRMEEVFISTLLDCGIRVNIEREWSRERESSITLTILLLMRESSRTICPMARDTFMTTKETGTLLFGWKASIPPSSDISFPLFIFIIYLIKFNQYHFLKFITFRRCPRSNSISPTLLVPLARNDTATA